MFKQLTTEEIEVRVWAAIVMVLSSILFFSVITIAGATPKQDKPEFEVMKQLIDRLDRMADRDPMSVTVDGDKVTVKKGENTMESVR